ncbi:MAG: ATP-binding protein [Prevotella sp.]|nr:ATP-binding protein [Prevotella sp.]
MTVQEIRQLRETEDRVEFKEAKNGFNFAGGSHADPAERRKCVLGYVVALANEGGLFLGLRKRKNCRMKLSERLLRKIKPVK